LTDVTVEDIAPDGELVPTVSGCQGIAGGTGGAIGAACRA